MKTFSIAIGRFSIPAADLVMAGTGIAQVGGQQGGDANTREAQEAAFQRAFQQGAISEDEVEAEETDEFDEPVGVPPFNVSPGDTIEFGTDASDYSTCVLTVWHADGSQHVARWTRNGHMQSHEYIEAPPPPASEPVEEAGTEPDVPEGTPTTG